MFTKEELLAERERRRRAREAGMGTAPSQPQTQGLTQDQIRAELQRRGRTVPPPAPAIKGPPKPRVTDPMPWGNEGQAFDDLYRYDRQTAALKQTNAPNPITTEWNARARQAQRAYLKEQSGPAPEEMAKQRRAQSDALSQAVGEMGVGGSAFGIAPTQTFDPEGRTVSQGDVNRMLPVRFAGKAIDAMGPGTANAVLELGDAMSGPGPAYDMLGNPLQFDETRKRRSMLEIAMGRQEPVGSSKSSRMQDMGRSSFGTEQAPKIEMLPTVPLSAPKDEAEIITDFGGTIAGALLGPGKAIPKEANLGRVATNIGAKGTTGAKALGYGTRISGNIAENVGLASIIGANMAPEGQRVEMAGQLAADPLTWALGPALSAIYRSSIGIRTLGASITPQSIQLKQARQILLAENATDAQKQAAIETIDRMTPPVSPQELFNSLPDGEKQSVVQRLQQAGMTNEEIVAAIRSGNTEPPIRAGTQQADDAGPAPEPAPAPEPPPQAAAPAGPAPFSRSGEVLPPRGNLIVRNADRFIGGAVGGMVASPSAAASAGDDGSNNPLGTAGGVVAGALLPRALGNAGGRLGRTIQRAAGGAANASRFDQRVSSALVRRQLEEAGLTSPAAVQAAMRAAFGNEPATIADLTQQGLGTAVGLTRLPGTTGEVAAARAAELAETSMGRTQAGIEDAIRGVNRGLNPGTITGDVDELIAAAQAEASPAYQALRAQYPLGSLDSGRLMELLDQDIMRPHVQAAQRYRDTIAISEGRQVGDFEFVDIVKRSLDDAEQRAIGRNERVPYDLESARVALLEEMDRLVPGYPEARRLGGEAPRMRQAFSEGQRLLQGRFSVEDIGRIIEETTGAALTATQAGVIRAMIGKVETGRGALQALTGPGTRQKLARVFGQEAADAMQARFKAEEALMRNARQMDPNVGSVTSRAMLSEPAGVGPMIAQAVNTVRNPLEAGLAYLSKSGAYSQAQRDLMGEMLLGGATDANLARIFPPGRTRPPRGRRGGPPPAAPQGGPPPASGRGPAAGPASAGPVDDLPRGPAPAAVQSDPPFPDTGPATAGQADPSPSRVPVSEQVGPWDGPVPKKPQSLVAWIRSQGGIKDTNFMRGDLRSIMGRANGMPGLLNNKSGTAIDELTRRAYNQGFDVDPEDANSLMRLINEEFGGNPSYRIGAREEWDIYQEWLAARRGDFDDPTSRSPAFIGGAGVGALTGAAMNPDDPAAGALIGAGVGAVGGAAAGRMLRRGGPPPRRMPPGRGVNAMGLGGGSRASSDDIIRQAEAQGYAGQDIGEAQEWVRAREKGLDMSQGARMERARAMGFDTDTVLYHGTPDSRGVWTDGFKTPKEKFGQTDPERVYFFAEDRKTASTYADDRRAFDYQNATAETIPVYLRMQNPKVIQWNGRPFRGREKDGSGFAIRDYIDQARAEGHDGVIIRNVIDTYDGKGKPSTIRAVFNPANIRSVNAAFDPAEAGSRNILAGMGANPAATGALTVGAAGVVAPYDTDGDGVIDDNDRAAFVIGNMITGGVGGAVAGRLMPKAARRGPPTGPATMGVGGRGETGRQIKAETNKLAASIRMSAGEKALTILESLPKQETGANMLQALRSSGVLLTPEERATFQAVFPASTRASRRDVESFFKTVASPRNHFAQNIEGFGEVGKRLTDEELDSLSAKTAPQVMAILNDLRNISPIEEGAAVAIAGAAKKGWYLRSQKALEAIFGVDAPRFAAVLAAMSPQTSVESNLTNAVSFWTNWTKAGRPTDEARVLEILGQSVQGGKGEGSVLDAWRNNTVRAVTAENPIEALLSGPKVDSFRRNLRAREVPGVAGPSSELAQRGANAVMDDTEYATTLDAWMANYFNFDQELFARGGGKSQPGYSPGYLAGNAYTREVAEYLTKKTGEAWSPREVQETIWSWAKTLFEARQAAGESRSAFQLIREKALTDAQIGGTPDFAILLSESPALRAVLEEAGYGRQIADLAGNPGAIQGNAPSFLGVRSGPQDATGSGFSQRDYDRRLGRAASRLDDLADRRARDAREERVRTTRSNITSDGGSPRAYTQESGRDSAPVRVLGQRAVATYTPDRDYQRAYAKNQIEMPDVHELPANPQAGAAYAKRMQEATSKSPYGAAVHIYSPEEYASMRLFVAADGKAGFALKGDDIVSAWSDPKGRRGRMDSLIPLAVQMGGRRLDAFDTVLPQIYSRHGFRIESRLRWNDEFAPSGWDKSLFSEFNNGQPDVVFMVWDPAYNGRPKATDGVVASSYEEAVAVQAASQKEIADRISSGAILSSEVSPAQTQARSNNILSAFPGADDAAIRQGTGRQIKAETRRDLDAMGFYSAVQETAKLIPDNIWNMGWQAARSALAKGREGITPRKTEIEYLGLDAMFGDTSRSYVLKGAELKDAVMEHIAAKRLSLVENFARFDPNAKRPTKAVMLDELSDSALVNVLNVTTLSRGDSKGKIITATLSREGEFNTDMYIKPIDAEVSDDPVKRYDMPSRLYNLYRGADLTEKRELIATGTIAELRAKAARIIVNENRARVLRNASKENIEYYWDYERFEGGGLVRGPGDIRLPGEDVPLFEAVIGIPKGVPGADYQAIVSHVGGKAKGTLVTAHGEERVDDMGQRTVFVGQVQSDMAQEARKPKNQIKDGDKLTIERINDLYWMVDENGKVVSQSFENPDAAEAALSFIKTAAGAPLLTTSEWTNVAVRAMIYRAARGGFQSISFPTAETSKIIQKNDFAAQHYETNVKGALEKIGKQLGGKVRKGWVEYDQDYPDLNDQSRQIVRLSDGTEISRGELIESLHSEYGITTGTLARMVSDALYGDLSYWTELGRPRKTIKAAQYLEGLAPTGKMVELPVGRASSYILDITPAMREKIMSEGFPLFAFPGAGNLAQAGAGVGGAAYGYARGSDLNEDGVIDDQERMTSAVALGALGLGTAGLARMRMGMGRAKPPSAAKAGPPVQATASGRSVKPPGVKGPPGTISRMVAGGATGGAVGALAGEASGQDDLTADIAKTRQEIEDLQAALKEWDKLDVKGKQELLVKLGRVQSYYTNDKGKRVKFADGTTGDRTEAAFNAYVKDKTDALTTARNDLIDFETRSAYREFQQEQNPFVDALRELGPSGAAIVGGVAATVLRARGVGKSKEAVKLIEADINDLLTKGPVKSLLKKGGAANTERNRAVNMNQFYRQGGAPEEKLPFVYGSSGWKVNPKKAPVGSLYTPKTTEKMDGVGSSVLRPFDVKVIGAGLFDAALVTPFVEDAKEELRKAQEDVEKGNESIEALRRVEKAKTNVAMYEALQRLGLGVAGAGVLGLGYRYKLPKPDIRSADEEVTAISDFLKANAPPKPPRAPRAPRTQPPAVVGPPKPWWQRVLTQPRKTKKP